MVNQTTTLNKYKEIRGNHNVYKKRGYKGTNRSNAKKYK